MCHFLNIKHEYIHVYTLNEHNVNHENVYKSVRAVIISTFFLHEVIN